MANLWPDLDRFIIELKVRRVTKTLAPVYCSSFLNKGTKFEEFKTKEVLLMKNVSLEKKSKGNLPGHVPLSNV